MTPSAFKKVLAINGASTTNAATATGTIDRLGFDYAVIDVCLTTSNNVTNNPSVLKISESDTTDATNFSDIGVFKGDDTTDGFTIPNAQTAGITGPFVTFNVDLTGRKRYLQVDVSPLTTQIVTVLAQLGRGKEMPADAADHNALALVQG